MEPVDPQHRPRLEVADIFRTHGEVYRRAHSLSEAQLRVMRDIVACRTAVLGGHIDECDNCGHTEISYNSCRNRHCPKCQSLRQARWVEQRMERVLPTHHFHVVFTVPEQLKPLALRNRERFYDLLLTAAARTLLELGQDPKRLGGVLGVTAILHTWTRSLLFHPHVHCIVTGGGLSDDGLRWVPADKGRGRYLFPIEVMGPLFRGKLLAALTDAIEHGEIQLDDACAKLADPTERANLWTQLYRMKWVVYCKRPFGEASHVLKYLGRYTHRVGISNQRLISMDDRGVTFATKNGATATLSPDEFVRRFLLHVLPPGFVKIRHFGLHAPGNVNTKLVAARLLLDPDTTESSIDARPLSIVTLILVAAVIVAASRTVTWRDLLRKLTGLDVTRRRICGQGPLTSHSLPRESRALVTLPQINDSS